MAIDFPDSPTEGEQYTVGDRTWTWNGTYWQTSTSMSTFTASDSEPVDADAGDIWFDSTIGKTFVNYGGNWVEIGAAGSVVDVIADADADTKIQVEVSADSDKIEFTTAGTKRLEIDASGHVIPAANETYDLGSASARFRDIYLSGASIDLGGAAISSDGTNLTMPPVSNISGDFTVDTDTLHVDATNDRVGIGTTSPSKTLDVIGDAAFSEASTADFFVSSGTGADVLPSGTTAQRPSNPAEASIRYNSELKQLEAYLDGSWKIVVSSFFAAGGDVTSSNGYIYHTFTTSGTFSVLSSTKNVEYLIVAGGGGGGSTGDIQAGGGGGAGGYISGSTTVSLGSYSVIVGAGGSLGTSSTSWDGTDGANSSVFGQTAIGGGGGGGEQDRSGRSGGSGGGRASGGGGGVGGSATSGQGNIGGGDGNQSSPFYSGGGGGASQEGQDQFSSPPGYNGGDGSQWLNGSYYAGGGGGGERNSGVGLGEGGTGGGGNGGRVGGPAATPGSPNTGGGGGGGQFDSSGANGANGGSGIVIIRYTL